MKMKNINPLEQHVEKVVAVVVVLLVAWLCYRNIFQDPDAVVLPGSMSGKVMPGRVGEKINQAVDTLRRSVKDAESSANVQRGVIPDYQQIYTLSQIQPLASALTQLPAVPFGPRNQPLQNTINPVAKNWVFHVPRVPRLTELKAVQGRGVATDTPVPQDIHWVELTAIFPLTRWHKSLAGGSHLKADESGLPRSYRRTTFYRVQVRRQPRLPSGQWGPWVPVKGTYLQPLPQVDLSHATPRQIAAALGLLDQARSQIITPAFHTLEATRHLIAPVNQPQPPVVPQPGPGGVPPFRGGFPPRPGAFNNGPAGAGGAQAAMARMLQMQRMQQLQRARQQQQILQQQMQQQQMQEQQMQQNNGVLQEPPQGAGVSGGNGAGLTDIPVIFYDQTALPGEQYRYEMRVVLYNPVFEFPYHLTDPAAKSQAWLVSAWSKPTKSVKIRQSEYFFLVSSQLGSQGQASFRIFKWVQNVWTVADEWVAPGQAIGNVQQVPLMNNVTGALQNQPVNFSTGYTLVDAKENASGSSLTIVVEHPNGSLSLRTSAWDAANPEQSRLNARVTQTGIAPTPVVPGVPKP
ncbi:MAG: hypothetical protein HKL95_08940 [Phycisphaerae bacterium]|nr:hypothetical protein [Phycisphaerae bacterium]